MLNNKTKIELDPGGEIVTGFPPKQVNDNVAYNWGGVFNLNSSETISVKVVFPSKGDTYEDQNKSKNVKYALLLFLSPLLLLVLLVPGLLLHIPHAITFWCIFSTVGVLSGMVVFKLSTSGLYARINPHALTAEDKEIFKLAEKLKAEYSKETHDQLWVKVADHLEAASKERTAKTLT